MPQNDFYLHMSRIAYPMQMQNRSEFLFGAASLPESAIVDAGFIVGIDAEYDPQMRIKLTAVISLPGTGINFSFTDEAGSATFVFSCNTTDPLYAIHEVDALEGSGYGSAFIVTGDLSQLKASFVSGTYNATSDYYVERALVQSLNKSFVKQITTGTEPGTRWSLPTECGGTPDPHLYEYVVTARNLTGDIRFEEGYNAVINISEDDNSIELTAGSGAGEGPACEPTPLPSLSSTSSEVKQATCSEVLSTLNGVIPDENGNFYLRALSSGLRVITEPSNHKVIIEAGAISDKPYCPVQ